MSGRIEPRTLKGFRDYLPEMMIPRERLLEAARGVYRRYGFAPIDTPALEYAEILLGKGGEESDKIVYRFQDHGNRDVALRFDLTVPFARFAAMHVGKLGIPFKRYAMGPVWRGENTGHGRYREFWQCDFDTIGTTSVSSDAEALLVAHDLMVAAGIERFVLRVNHRQVLGGLLETMGLGGSGHSHAARHRQASQGRRRRRGGRNDGKSRGDPSAGRHGSGLGGPEGRTTGYFV